MAGKAKRKGLRLEPSSCSLSKQHEKKHLSILVAVEPRVGGLGEKGLPLREALNVPTEPCINRGIFNGEQNL